MALFQSSVITKHLQNQNKENIALKWESFKNHFHNPKVQEEIKSLKEEQYQGEFLEDFFVKILGYTKPASSSETKFNLKFSTIRSSAGEGNPALIPTSPKGSSNLVEGTGA